MLAGSVDTPGSQSLDFCPSPQVSPPSSAPPAVDLSMPSSDARILVTGSRDWPLQMAVWGAIGIAAQEFTAHKLRLVIIHGDARGADTMAHEWTVINPMFGMVPVIEEVHRPAWDLQGKGAGMWRNRRMVESGADVCLAFIKDSSRGATHCAQYAEGAGIPVRYYRV